MGRKMKDSGVEWIGEIPEDTKLIQLRFIADITTGNMDTQNRENDGEYPFYVRSPKVERSNQYSFDDVGAILMAGDGVGAGRVFHYVQGKYACHQRVYRMNNFRYVQSSFLKYYLEGLFPMIMDQGSAKSTVDSVRLPMLQGFKVVVFNEAEQQKIIDFLDEKVGEIDSVIANTKETIEDYKKYKQAIITDAVTKGLNPNVEMKESKLQWVDTIPRYWKENKISHIISMPVIDGPHVSPELVDNGVPFISADAIENGKINFDRKRGFITKEYSEECNKRYKPQKNDILVVKLGASTGKMAIVGDETNFNIWVPLAVVRCKVDILPQYIFYSMESSYFKNEIRNGWTFGTQETLGVKTLEQLKVFVPSLEEQKEIAEYLNEKCFEIDKLIAKKEELLADLEDYKKSLIYEYVTGKKEVE